MKTKRITLPVIIFVVGAVLILGCVLCLFGKSHPVSVDEKIVAIMKADGDASQAMLASIEQQSENTKTALKEQIEANIRTSLQSLAYRIKGDFDSYANV